MLAHSSSSYSASSASSFSLFDTDSQSFDSDTDSSPLSPENDFPGHHPISVTKPFKFLHADRSGSGATPKQQPYKAGNDSLNNDDDMNYDSGREGCASTRRNLFRVLKKRRGVPSRFQGVGLGSPAYEDNDTCKWPGPGTPSTVFSPRGHLSSVGPRTTDSALQSPRIRKEFIGLGLDLGFPVEHGLFGAISIDDALVSGTQTRHSHCPLKPHLLPILDAASPSPICSLPSPVLALGLDASDRIITDPSIWPVPSSQEMPAPSPLNLATVYNQERKTSLVSLDLHQINSINNGIEPVILGPLPKKVSADDCTVSQRNYNPDLVSGNTSGRLVGLDLGLSLSELQTSNETQKIEQTSTGALPAIFSSSGSPLSQAIVFASIPFCSAQPRPKKSAIGLGLGRPAGLGHRTQVKHASQSASFSYLPAGKGVPRGDPNIPSSPCSPSRRGIVAGARRLFKPHGFPKRRLYAIPEVVSPTFLSPIGRSGATKLVFAEVREGHPRVSLNRQSSIPMASGIKSPSSSCGISIPARLPPTETPPKTRPCSNSPRYRSPKSPYSNDSMRRSPILIRLHVPQKLNFMKRRQSGATTWNGLCSLF